MDIEGNADDFEEPDFVELQESPTNTLLQHEGPIDHERVIHLISIGEWEEVLVLLTKDMDPWNIDIAALADKYLKKIQSLKGHDLRIPANAILASAILLKFKARAIKISSIEDEEEVTLNRIQAEELKGKVNIRRFKGLGEMNPLQLRETTMSSDTRRLVQLTLMDDTREENVMDMLLAKKRAADRKEWLEKKGDLASA